MDGRDKPGHDEKRYRFQVVRKSAVPLEPSVTLRQIEHLLGDEAEDQLLGDRRQPRDRHFAEQPLDMIFLGVSETAMGHDGLPRGVVAGARAEEFRAVGLRAAGLAVVVQPRRAHHHLPCRFEIHPFFRERMLDALILSDRAIEHDAVARIFGGAAKRILADAHRFGADQDTLRIEAVQDVGEALALLADPVLIRDEQTVDENGV